MKKIGLICLAVVLALGGLGIGFAHWSDQLYIEGTVETGEVLIGFVDQLTDDDGVVDNALKDWDDDGSDPLWLGADPPTECSNCPNVGKDVASTTCVMLNQKTMCAEDIPAVHNDLPVYETIQVTLDNVYPQYNPTLWFDIANAGSIPVNIVGAWIISIGGVPLPVAEWIELPKCEMVQVDLTGDDLDDIAIGFSAPVDAAGVLIEPQQIDPCDVAQYDLHFYVKQDCPQCTTLNFEIKIAAVQWNKTLVWPGDFE